MKTNEFKYIKNMGEDGVSTMLIYDIIGKYYNDQTGQVECRIDGTAFANELEYLQSVSKQINVRINSAGGNVLDGYAIFDAIRNSKVPVYTYNVGLCASIASIIFLAGHKRIMNDFSSIMIHNPDSPSEDSSKLLKIIKDQLLTILQNNSILLEGELSDLMNEETYFDSSEALKSGLVDEVIKTNRKTPKINKSDIHEMVDVYNQLIKKEEMKKAKTEKTSKSEAEEIVVTDVVTEIENIVDKKETAKEEAAEPAEEEKTETPEEEKVENVMCEDDGMTMDEAKKVIAELTNKLEKMEAEKAKAKADKIKNMLNTFVTNKTITNDEIPGLEKLADKEFDVVYNMLSRINPAPVSVNKESVKIFNQANAPLKGRESWTIRDWEKKDAKGLEKIKSDNIEVYNDMFNSFYKK